MMVNYNTREMTLECLRSIYAHTQRQDFEIILVDNASTDGSVEAISKEFPDVRVMAETENHGFAKATNMSVPHAKGKYILLLNTDTVILDKAIDNVLAFAETHPHAKIWGGRTLFADGSLNATSCWGQMTPWSLFSQAVGLTRIFKGSSFFNPEAYGNWKRDTVRPVDIVTGCFFLIEKDFWDELGGFADEFYMYGEEADLCLRARKLGADPHITPEATLIHYGGATANKVIVRKKIWQLGAKSLLIRNHWSPLTKPFGLFFLTLNVFVRMTGFRLMHLAKRGGDKARNTETWTDVWSARQTWINGY